MTRRRSLTSQLYRAARISNNISAIASGNLGAWLAGPGTFSWGVRWAVRGCGAGSGSEASGGSAILRLKFIENPSSALSSHSSRSNAPPESGAFVFPTGVPTGASDSFFTWLLLGLEGAMSDASGTR